MAMTHKTWTQALDEIDETFRKWPAARNLQITSQVVGRTPAQLRKSAERATDDVGEREVTLSFTWRPVGQPERSVRLATAHETRPVANLAHLAQAAETLWLAEVRGVNAVLASAYRQMVPAPAPGTHAPLANPAAPAPTPAPTTFGAIATCGPYAVLRLPSGAPLIVAEAVHPALLMAMRGHQVEAWSATRMQELDEAMEQIRHAEQLAKQTAGGTPIRTATAARR